MFTPRLRINDYLVEDDPISPREKVNRKCSDWIVVKGTPVREWQGE